MDTQFNTLEFDFDHGSQQVFVYYYHKNFYVIFAKIYSLFLFKDTYNIIFDNQYLFIYFMALKISRIHFIKVQY